jgi:glutathione S-transferase
MPARIYTMPISNPAAAGAAMVAYKQIPHRVVTLMPGFHPPLVRLAGFERFTVPALEFDGRKVQGTRRISRFLDEVKPEPPLFPRDPDARARVEEAERWGEQVLQPVPRRLFRHLVLTSERSRIWLAREVMHLPFPRLMGWLFMPADFQVLASARVLLEFEALAGLLDGRPSAPAARRIYPHWVGPIPGGLPTA